ncbi:MAG TPA: glycosyltransferase family 39 protein [Candidatus Polarisedimenticolia bacterium]|nr:glycosyltransferase family 39 protein [Candidatus Polarisedimenticolia bacterium]
MRTKTPGSIYAPSAPLPGFPKLYIVGVLLLFAGVYGGSLFSPGLQDDADSTHAEASREMAVTHNYVTLKVNGNRYLEKAPLMYWAVSLCYRCFGVNEFAAHLPVAVSMLLLVLLAMRWGRRAFGDRAAIYAGLFVSSAAGCYLFTRILIPESILSFFIAASFYFFATALEHGDGWRWYVGYASMALSVLTKGLLAIVVIGLALSLYFAISGEWRRWREFRLFTGTVLFLVIAAPWHILAGIRNPHFYWFYFVNEHFMRFLGKRIPKDYNKQTNSLYWTLHLVWLFPWSLYLPVALRRPITEWMARRKRGELKSPRPLTFRSRTERLCLVWAGVTLVFFSFSTNQEYYTFPAYLPILLLIAARLANEEESGSRRWLLWSSGALAVICIGISIVLAAGLWDSRHLPFVADIGTVLAKPNLQAETLSMGHMLDLTGESFAALRLPAIMATVILLIGPAVAFWLRRRGSQFAATWTTAATMAAFLMAAHIALVRFDPFLGSRSMARQIAPELRPNDRVMIYGDQSFGSSLLFYLRRPIELVNGNTTSMWWGSTYADAPHIFLDDQALLRAWISPERVFLFVPEHERARVEALLPGPLHIASEVSGKVILTNHP